MRELKSFVREHKVCWEIAPHFEVRAGELRQVGFDLTLHAQAAAWTDPGSAEALVIHDALHEIALRVLPRDARFEVRPFEAALRFRRETAWSAEIDLVIEVRHRAGTFDVVDRTECRRAPSARPSSASGSQKAPTSRLPPDRGAARQELIGMRRHLCERTRVPRTRASEVAQRSKRQKARDLAGPGPLEWFRGV